MVQPIRSTTQISVVTHHQYGISMLILQGNQCWRWGVSPVFSGYQHFQTLIKSGECVPSVKKLHFLA